MGDPLATEQSALRGFPRSTKVRGQEIISTLSKSRDNQHCRTIAFGSRQNLVRKKNCRNETLPVAARCLHVETKKWRATHHAETNHSSASRRGIDRRGRHGVCPNSCSVGPVSGPSDARLRRRSRQRLWHGRNRRNPSDRRQRWAESRSTAAQQLARHELSSALRRRVSSVGSG
jgi:hypothetical protein